MTFTVPGGSLWLGDCLELMRYIPDDSVDMVLCDLPYGITACKWDAVIPFEPLWSEYWRVCKPNAAVVLTASQPFTSALVMSQVERFRYCWVWNKVQPTGFLNAKKQPLKVTEEICIFYNSLPVYNPQMTEGVERKRSPAKNLSIEIYRQGIHQTGIYADQNSSTERYPLNLLNISKGQSPNARTIHPTQKPVALFEYLIKTYTNAGELVLDNCSGGGTTAIAAHRTGRRWLCIERDPEYYLKSALRIQAECLP